MQDKGAMKAPTWQMERGQDLGDRKGQDSPGVSHPICWHRDQLKAQPKNGNLNPDPKNGNYVYMANIWRAAANTGK